MELTIQQVSDKVGISSFTLRYYEKVGLLPSVRRNPKGRRIFNETDISWIELIRCLRNTGMSIEDVKRIVELSMLGDNTIPDRKQILRNHRLKMEQQMEELKRYIEKIDSKINWYNQKSPDR